MGIANMGIRFVLVESGLGRHIKDPSITRENLMRCSYYLWVNSLINITAMALLMFSICVYLLALDFFKLYRYIVWLCILVILGVNFLSPILTLLRCTPMEAN
jgi:hypothetical protein